MENTITNINSLTHSTPLTPLTPLAPNSMDLYIARVGMEGAEKYDLDVILECRREVSARALLDEPIRKSFPHSMLLADNRSDQHGKIKFKLKQRE